MKNKWILLSGTFLLLLSIILFIEYIKKNSESVKHIHKISPQISESKGKDFIYNSPAPDFIIPISDACKFKLSQWKGYVIILRFTQFTKREFPSLVYLDHLAQKYCDDVRLAFIISLHKQNTNSIKEAEHFSSLIIEDDNLLSSIFSTIGDETIIIGRDFRMKFMSLYADVKTISSMVKRYAFENSPRFDTLPEEKLSELIKKIWFRDLKTGETKLLIETMRNRDTLISLFITVCISCPETEKISFLKDLLTKINNERSQIIFLFGRGNNLNILNDFLNHTDLDKLQITLGLIEETGELLDREYYQIFDFDIDPRLFLFKNGDKLVFIEKIDDKNKIIRSDFLTRMFYSMY